MILVFSSDDDYSTNEVLLWLDYYKVPFIRINEFNINCVKFFENELYLIEDKLRIKLSEVNAVWIRRGGFIYNLPFTYPNDNSILFNIWQHLNSESVSLINFSNYLIDKKKVIGALDLFNVNKLSTLYMAKELGLLVPDTMVTTDKEDLISFIAKHQYIITKNIQDIIIIQEGKNLSYSYTEVLTDDILKHLPEKFSPSLFQEKVTKNFEIRSFFLHGCFYSMAIFSQSDKQTEVDFRKYNYEKPSRIAPFQLPYDIEDKLRLLMIKLKLNTGSFDIIYNTKREFVFLEVNPVGQYDMVGKTCNYFLDKKISEKLIEFSKI